MSDINPTPEISARLECLIVDDDPGDRQLCKRFMASSFDCDYLEAESVERGLAMFAAHEPDLILLDYQLAGATALEFLEQLGAAHGHPLPVVVLTGNASQELAIEVMRLGALDYLPKSSLSPASLRRAATNALQKIGMYRALEQKTHELARAREVAELANERKGRFLAHVSHELRTPLTAIIGFAEELGFKDLGESERSRAIDAVLSSSAHLLQVVNDLLDHSKCEAGRIEIDLRPTDPIELVSEVLEVFEGRARTKGLALIARRATAIPSTISTDPMRMRQILLNLVSNAVKFTQHGEVALIMALHQDHEGARIELRVLDSGIGLNEEQIARLFRPFEQAEASTAREFGGTGLGLTISQQLAGLLGGKIDVASVPGRGSVFTLELPVTLDGVRLVPPDEAREEAPRPEETRPDEYLGARLLVAEDVPATRVLMHRILERAGCTVTSVENGDQAIEAALAAERAGEPYDVVLMDMQMPVLTGYEATRRLREQGYARPILALTAMVLSEDLELCRTVGCDGHAAKPIQRGALIRLIRDHAGLTTDAASVPRQSVQRQTATPMISKCAPRSSVPEPMNARAGNAAEKRSR